MCTAVGMVWYCKLYNISCPDVDIIFITFGTTYSTNRYNTCTYDEEII